MRVAVAGRMREMEATQDGVANRMGERVVEREAERVVNPRAALAPPVVRRAAQRALRERWAAFPARV